MGRAPGVASTDRTVDAEPTALDVLDHVPQAVELDISTASFVHDTHRVGRC